MRSFTRFLLTPASWLYGLGTSLRNLLFDKGILKQYKAPVPVIVIGNLLAGGTGKTPVTAWLAKTLGEEYRVAILSRGYGRRSRGFHLAGPNSTPDIIGDEPAELHMLLPDTLIAVDRNRVRGIKNLTSGMFGPVDLILMDDGFQHQRVKPGFALLLDNPRRPMDREPLLPAGLRRESLRALKRADKVITTHVTPVLSGIPAGSEIILITGIAHPEPLVETLTKHFTLLRHLRFPDHHRYTKSDLKLLSSISPHHLITSSPAILCTGKDFVKLRQFPGLTGLQMIPASHGIAPEEEKLLLDQIRSYVKHHVEQNR